MEAPFDEDLESSASWQEKLIDAELDRVESRDQINFGKVKLTAQQRILSDFVEKAARCISEQQVKALRVPFVQGADDKCGVCGCVFWTLGVTLPKQRHHCYCCGKALCNACTLSVQMENGHRAADGHYVRDFVWSAKFCIDHDLVTGETKEVARQANESGWSVLPQGPLAWLGFLVRVGAMIVSVFPVVSSLSTVYYVGKPLLWTYRAVRLFV